MHIKSIEDVNKFLAAVGQCKHDVRLESPWGDVFNLKSALTQYTAIHWLLSERGDELELFCDKSDEPIFLQFFGDNPHVLAVGYPKFKNLTNSEH